MRKNSFCILLFMLVGFTVYPLASYAQVTIGSDAVPLEGSLLQLKETESANGEVNAHRGLGMPRVNLTDVVNLYPMFEANGLEYKIGSTNYVKADEMTKHIGLLVYNINKCLVKGRYDGNASGLFVWDGTQWQIMNADATLPTETAANSNRSDWKTVWGTNAILHQAKSSVYEEFTSADFGTAGRWMTSNLAATAYDGNSNPYRTLTGPNADTDNPNKAYWAYPSLTSPTSNTEYNADKRLGLLYSWDAATAGKGGSSGEDYSENEGGVDHAQIQGICPVGWHLPSDKEWTVLQNEIIANTNLYSSIANIGSPLLSITDNQSEGEWGDAPLGAAMKDACEPFEGVPNQGISKSISQGGFSILLAGYENESSDGSLGTYGVFWTSSYGYSSGNAWNRYVTDNEASVTRGFYKSSDMYTIRCKKNN